MSRIPYRILVPVVLAVAAAPAWAQQLQRPTTPTSPTTSPTTATPAPTPVPANASQRARPATGIPEAGPAPRQSMQPTPATQTAPMRTPHIPGQVRDAQGRVIPGAQETIPGRARDPATGQEFQTTPATRPD